MFDCDGTDSIVSNKDTVMDARLYLLHLMEINYRINKQVSPLLPLDLAAAADRLYGVIRSGCRHEDKSQWPEPEIVLYNQRTPVVQRWRQLTASPTQRRRSAEFNLFQTDSRTYTSTNRSQLFSDRTYMTETVKLKLQYTR